MRSKPVFLVSASFLLGLALALRLPAQEPAAVLAEIAASKLDPARAVTLNRLKLDIGLANLQLDAGTLFPATPVAGGTVELVFEGKGRVRLTPPNEIETQQ